MLNIELFEEIERAIHHNGKKHKNTNCTTYKGIELYINSLNNITLFLENNHEINTYRTGITINKSFNNILTMNFPNIPLRPVLIQIYNYLSC